MRMKIKPRIYSILNRHLVEQKKKYLVEQTGIGYKIQNGKLTDTVAILFYVKKKKNKDELVLQWY